MFRGRRAVRPALVSMVGLAILAGVVAAPAEAEPSTVTGPAESTAVAERLPSAPPVDVVSISGVADVDDALWTRAREAAHAAGARAALGRSLQAQVTAVTRGAEVVQTVPVGWALPFALTILPIDVVDSVMGRVVSSAIDRRDRVVLAASSAEMRGAVQGDVIHLRDARGGSRPFVIARVVADDVLGGTELVMSDTSAAGLGLSPAGRVVIYDIPSRERLDAELDARGLVDSEEFDVLQPSTQRLRVRRSWLVADPDATLGLLQTKLLLGEFAFVVRSSESVSISQEWIDDNIACDSTRPVYYCRALIDPSIPVKARCHDDVMDGLRSAFAEIARKGLSPAIDVANANSFGGCFNPRFNRLSRDPLVGSLSRHAWAMALDTNTTTNAQGSVPRLDCRVVRIFRKWGFSWGGNYLTPDGMHFEWVGDRRHRIAYPSKYCPNAVSAGRRARGHPPLNRSTLFAQDGWAGEAGD